MKNQPALILFLFFIFSFSNASFASTKDSIVYKNLIYVELLGNANTGLYSFNYERVFDRKKSKLKKINLRTGLSYNEIDKRIRALLCLNFISGYKHKFEIGCGLYFSHDFIYTNVITQSGLVYKKANKIASTFNIGYRYQNPSKRLVFRIGYTPTFYPHWDTLEMKEPLAILFWGISIGYSL